MAEAALKLGGEKKTTFKDKVMEILPQGGNLNACLTCGACSAGCPASGLYDMDPRKFLRMTVMGLDDVVTKTPWVWCCTQCRRCVHACPMSIDIPKLVYEARGSWPREERPKGILGSCDMALKTEGNSAMGASSEDFKFVVEDVLEEVKEEQKGMEKLVAPIDKKGAKYLLNQNSREPVTEAEEMVPLWKILNTVGADWTYATLGWGGENYCMFLSDTEAWEKITRNKVKAAEDLGVEVYLNTE